jgi:hypothetical protein
MLKAGQVIAKQSFPKWYELHLKLLYSAIKKYQKIKWGKNWEAVHIYLVIEQDGELQLFEQTWPIAKFTPVSYLKDKTYSVCEWVPVNCHFALNINCLLLRTLEQNGNEYDLGDLLDFGISGFILRTFRWMPTIFGDKARRSLVCSTMVANILKRCGCNTIENPLTCDPAYFENDENWHVVERHIWET